MFRQHQYFVFFSLFFAFINVAANTSTIQYITNDNSVQDGYVKSDTTTSRYKYLYYDINLIAGGGSLSSSDYIIDFDLFNFALGFSKAPILFSIKIAQFQTIIPWGSKTLFTHSFGVRYIWGVEDNIRRYVYAELNWGNFLVKDEFDEQEEMKYGCRYLDVGFAATFTMGDFELVGFLLNGIETRIGIRLGNTDGKEDNPMLGLVGSAKFRLGWFGKIVKR